MNSKLLKFKPYEIEKAQLLQLEGGGMTGCDYQCWIEYCVTVCGDIGPSDPESKDICIDNCIAFYDNHSS